MRSDWACLSGSTIRGELPCAITPWLSQKLHTELIVPCRSTAATRSMYWITTAPSISPLKLSPELEHSTTDTLAHWSLVEQNIITAAEQRSTNSSCVKDPSWAIDIVPWRSPSLIHSPSPLICMFSQSIGFLSAWRVSRNVHYSGVLVGRTTVEWRTALVLLTILVLATWVVGSLSSSFWWLHSNCQPWQVALDWGSRVNTWYFEGSLSTRYSIEESKLVY